MGQPTTENAAVRLIRSVGFEHPVCEARIWNARLSSFKQSPTRNEPTSNGNKLSLRFLASSQVWELSAWIVRKLDRGSCHVYLSPLVPAVRALLALVLYPFVWLLLLPFRLIGIAVHGVLELVWAAVMLPARLLSAPFRL